MTDAASTVTMVRWIMCQGGGTNRVPHKGWRPAKDFPSLSVSDYTVKGSFSQRNSNHNRKLVEQVEEAYVDITKVWDWVMNHGEGCC